jgi:hypothetical protein
MRAAMDGARQPLDELERHERIPSAIATYTPERNGRITAA